MTATNWPDDFAATLARIEAERPAREHARRNPPPAFTAAIARLRQLGHRVRAATWDGGYVDYRGTTRAGETIHGGSTARDLDEAIRALHRAFREDPPAALPAQLALPLG